jgi:hypothetical protein
MKKFTQWVDVIREAEEKQQSELQKSYKEYFSAKLNKFGAKSPADLTAEQKAEFFNEIKKDWEKGTGAKPAGKKDVEEHGVKESEEVNESEEFDMSEGAFYRLPKATIANELRLTTMNLQNFFNHTSAGGDPDPGVLDSIIKSLGKVKKDLKKFDNPAGIMGTVYEAEEVNKSEEVSEAEVKNAKDFEEYAMTVLKKQHGDDFDEETAKEVIKDLSAEAEKDGDWGAAVGKLNA